MNKDVKQVTHGDQSPTAIAEGDVSISYDNRKFIEKKNALPVVALVVGLAVVAIVAITIISRPDVFGFDDLPQGAQDAFANTEAANGIDPARAEDAREDFFDRFTTIQTLLRNSGNDEIKNAADLWAEGEINRVERQLERLLGTPSAPVAELEYLVGNIKLLKLEFEQAHMYLTRAVEREPENSQYLAELGSVESLLGNSQVALAHHRKALSMRRAALQQQPADFQASKDVADSLEDVAWELYQGYRYDQAEEAYLESLGIRRELLEDQPGDKGSKRDVAASLNNLAILYDSMGERLDAMEYYSEAKEKTIDVLGTREHRDVTNILSNIGVLRVESSVDEDGNVDDEKIRKGIKEYTEALAIQRKLALNMKRDPTSDRHPDVAASLYNLGNAYHLLGETDRAVVYYKDSRDMYVEFLGTEHDLTQMVAAQLKMVCNCDD